MEQVLKTLKLKIDNDIEILERSNIVLIEYSENEKVGNLYYSNLCKDLNPHGSAPSWGKVYKVPKKLFFNKRHRDSMQWETDMILQVDDIVWFERTIFLNSPTIEHLGKTYTLMNYADIYMAERNGEIFTLNGYILVKPLEKISKCLEYESKETDLKEVIAIKVSPPVNYQSEAYDHIEVNEGDRLTLIDEYRIQLESPLFYKYSSETHYIIQRREIAYIHK